MGESNDSVSNVSVTVLNIGMQEALYKWSFIYNKIYFYSLKSSELENICFTMLNK